MVRIRKNIQPCTSFAPVTINEATGQARFTRTVDNDQRVYVVTLNKLQRHYTIVEKWT